MAKNILIIKPSALGDVATAMPVLASLRASFPGSKISWLVRNEFAPLLEMSDDLDEVVLFDRKRLGKWWCNPKVFGELVTFLSNLYKAKYDLVIDLQGLFRTGFFSWVTGSKKRFGMKVSRELASIFYTDKVLPNPEMTHVVDQFLDIASKAGCKTLVTAPNLSIDKDIAANVSSLLEQNSVGSDYAVFIPTAAHYFKCWPVPQFAAVAAELSSECSLKVIATGIAGDREYLDQLVSVDGSVINLAGQTNIKELVALIKGAKLVVSNDTGPGQIASVLGVPMVMVVGNTNPKRIGPYQRPECVAAVDPDKRCTAIEDSKPQYAVDKVDVDIVLQVIASLLEKV